MSKPALKFAVPLIAGIILQNFLDLSVQTLTLIFLTLTAMFIIFSALKLNIPKLLSLYLIVILSGSIKFFNDTKISPTNLASDFANDTAIVKIYGKITGEVEYRKDRANFVISAQKIFLPNGKSKRINGDIFVSVRKGKTPDDRLPEFEFGDIIEIIGVLKQPIKSRNPQEFDFAQYLKVHNIDAVLLSYIFSHIKIVEKFKPRFENPIEFLKFFAFKIRRFILFSIDKFFPEPESSFLKGLIAGYRGEITDEIKNAFINTGTYHILAVSGLHVGIIATAIFALSSFLRINILIRSIVTIVLLIIYAFVVGLPPSVVRAVIMTSFILLGFSIDRDADIYNLLGFSAILILLIDSKQLFHPGFQLSFCAVLSIVYFYPRIYHLISKKTEITRGKILPHIISLVIVSFSAQILTLPFTAQYFNKVSLIATFANLFVVPLVGIAVPAGFTTVAFSTFSDHIASVFANSTWLMLHIIISIAKFFGNLPFAYIELNNIEITLAILLFALVLLNIKSKTAMKRIIIAILLVANFYLYLSPNGVIQNLTGKAIVQSNDKIKITILDVGQGDAIFVKFPDGKTMLIDGGNKSFNFDPGERVIEPFLKKMGINKLDAILVTHPHNDHIGGIPYILEKFKVDKVIDNGMNYSSEIFKKYQELISKKGITHIIAKAGEKIELSNDARIYVLHPTQNFLKANETDYSDGHDVNNSSVVIKVQYGRNSFLFMGDAEKEAEESILKIYGDFIKSDWIKVGHHGSSTSSSPSFVLKIKPQWAVISVGKYNKYNHPSDIIIRRYKLVGAKIHRTDEEGAGVFESDGKEVRKIEWRN